MGHRAWAWRAPPAPVSVSTQASGRREAASKITTWPLATKASAACVPVPLNTIMCGLTGFLPVVARQRDDVAPARSITAAGRAADSRLVTSPPS
ncbi:hypothetical protein ACFQQB_70075 [Nonomuraea rubra]|uniref:hypothetical protein n=1 Tax=Nonomuraea rubra TaxID=46180 RepID=UPI00360CCC0F